MNKYQYSSQEISNYFAQNGTFLKLPKNHMVTDSEAQRQDIYYVKDGFVKAYTITKNGLCNLLVIHGAGEIFPLQSDVNIKVNNIYYETKTSTDLLKVPYRQYLDELNKKSPLLLDALNQTQLYLEIYRNTIESLQYRNMRERIVSKLLFLSWRFGNIKHVIEVDITHQDIADYLSISRETVSRVMNKLQKEGSIQQERRRIVIKDYQKLLNEL